MQASTLWQVIYICWTNAHLAPPDLIVRDVGKDFLASSFQANAHMLHIYTKSVPAEFALSITVAEQYHARIIQAYNIIQRMCFLTEKQE